VPRTERIARRQTTSLPTASRIDRGRRLGTLRPVPADDRPILPYERAPAEVHEWDPAAPLVAARIAALINARRPDLVVDHTGSSAVPGLPGKNVIDLGIEVPVEAIPDVVDDLVELGFQRQTARYAFPPTRPLLLGCIDHDRVRYRIHCHVKPEHHRVWGRDHARDLAFRDALRADPDLRDAYAERKRAVVGAGPVDGFRYSMAKTEWIRGTIEAIGHADPPILPPATIGVLGGGQLGRMLGFAARTMGYRLVVLDPDPDCPAAAVADQVIVGAYHDLDAALRMAERADVVTLELEHVSAEVVARLDWDWPMRPNPYALEVTQDRLEERRFLESEGAAVAPWREVHDASELAAGAATLGFPGSALRLKAAFGGYDGRSQLRLATPSDLDDALERLGRPAGEGILLERELDFEMELSVVAVRGIDGRAATFPVGRNRHDRGILVESSAPAPIPAPVATEAAALAARLAEGLDLVGTLTVELFLLRDGSLVVNELAPRVHNSGHWTVEGCATSQFEQHVRAICGLPLGSTALRRPVALVNLLGEGEAREGRIEGLERALADPEVHVHLYDKRRVFERRKMGHIVATGDDVEAALARAREARSRLRWAGG
jgi:5-(carboxyamino)imidazole ribonucleotide synthase